MISPGFYGLACKAFDGFRRYIGLALQLLPLQTDEHSTSHCEDPMSRGTVVLLGSLPAGRVPLADTVAEFGWSFEAVADEDGLQEMSDSRHVVAVLFDPKALEDSSLENYWSIAMNAVRRAAPGAFLIACQTFSDPIPWPELASQGAFHSLSLPVDAAELRRSLGFVWAAKRRHPPVIQLDQALRELKGGAAPASLERFTEPAPKDAAMNRPAEDRIGVRKASRAAEIVA